MMDWDRHNVDEFSIGFIRRPLAGYGCSQSICYQKKGEALSGFNALVETVAMRFKVWRNPATNEIIIHCLDPKPTSGHSNSITLSPRHARHLAIALIETGRNFLKNPILRSIGIPRGGAWRHHS
ncbi:MAG: hypothetical protein WAK26_11930 [Terracidiphilus sp.]